MEFDCNQTGKMLVCNGRQMKGGARMKRRYEWLHLWRSLAVLIMVVFHALWDMEWFGILPEGTMATPAADIARYIGGGSFIVISGMLALRSERSLRRGFYLLCLGLAVESATSIAGMPVRFGILQLLGICMIICGALRNRLLSLSGRGFTAICILLFFGTWVLTARSRVLWRFLYPLGLRSEDFYSADYWPLLPWAFLYLLGTQFGNSLLCDREEKRERKIPAALTFPGRHSLAIYLLHQPLLFGLCYLIFSGKN